MPDTQPQTLSWTEREVDAAAAARLAEELALPVQLARVLVSRGYGEPAAARAFLNPDIRQDFSPPFMFPGIRDAAERIWAAVRAGRGIVVYGDFDVDGVVATATLVTALRRLGGRAEPFLPLREAEGYGLTLAGLGRCLKEHALSGGLLITVDCGINSVKEVDYLNGLGIEVIITDHHEPGAALPKAAVVVNPWLGATKGAEHLCGAGLALKLVYALVECGRANGWYDGAPMGGDLLVAVGLATVADVVPLLGENRALVAGALKYWRRAGTGLQALLKRAIQSGRDELNVATFSFLLGPRINAAGRLGSAMMAYELLTTDDKDRAAEIAAKLESLNATRRGVELDIVAAARAQCGLGDVPGTFQAAAVVVGGGAAEGWHPGVIGIVASRLSETARVPAAVIAFDAENAGRGSLRAGTGYRAVEALQEVSDLLHGFGGHARAAGFTLKAGCLEAFKERFCAACERQRQQIAAGPPQPRLDGWLTADDVSLAFYQVQQRLAPFGEGNSSPRWGIRNVVIEQVRPMGQNGEHINFNFRLGNGKNVRGVWFRHGHIAEQFRVPGRVCDVLFALTQSIFGTELVPEMRITDIRMVEG